MTTLNDDIYIFHNMSELFLHSKIQKACWEICGNLRAFERLFIWPKLLKEMHSYCIHCYSQINYFYVFKQRNNTLKCFCLSHYMLTTDIFTIFILHSSPLFLNAHFTYPTAFPNFNPLVYTAHTYKNIGPSTGGLSIRTIC